MPETRTADGARLTSPRDAAPLSTDTIHPTATPLPTVTSLVERDDLQGLLDVLDLLPVPGTADTFLGRNQSQPWGRIYGGQILAQSLVATLRTIPTDRPVHSLHGYFLRAGDPDVPLTFAVERLRDGQSFSARRVQVLQDDALLMSMIASFQVADTGLDHHASMPDVPSPETLPRLADRFSGVRHPGESYWTRERPLDLRHVEGPVFLDAGSERAAQQAVWMRATGPLPDDPGLHAAVLAFGSDYTAMEPVLRHHGVPWATPGLRVASLDHAMWFHRAARADEWLLYAQESPSAGNARGLGLGRVYTRDGVLVCTIAQEGLVRMAPTR